MSKLRLLVVDDEPLIRTGIRDILKQLADVGIVSEAGSGDEAIRALQQSSFDLVLLDIRMPDCTGLDVVRRIGPERMPLVIFITAHHEFAVHAFEVNAVDYILKPFDEERLLASIRRAQDRLRTEPAAELVGQLRSLLQQQAPQYAQRIAARTRDSYNIVPVETIDWIESADNYIQLHCGSKTYLVLETMNSIEQRLDPATFIRLHRGRIVNFSRVTAVSPLANGVYEVQLQDGARLTTGRQYRNALMAMLGKQVN
jgi:two-component system LytT family response regulator